MMSTQSSPLPPEFRKQMQPVPLFAGVNAPQPAPIQNDSRTIWELVIEDMKARDNTGFKKYGTRLQAHNGRDALVDAYQEALDLAVYLKQAIVERQIYTQDRSDTPADRLRRDIEASGAESAIDKVTRVPRPPTE